MSELDFIDSIVDQCLGVSNPTSARRASSNATPLQTQNPAQPGRSPLPTPGRAHNDASGLRQGNAYPTNNAVPARELQSVTPIRQSMPVASPPPHAFQPAALNASGTGAMEYQGRVEAPHVSPENYAVHSAGDAAYRRIAIWEEKKRIKAQLARREHESRGLESCTFQPDLAAARSSVLAGKIASKSSNTESSPPRFAAGEGGSEASVDASLMTPSKLYQDNKAWGFDSFVDRQQFAREMRRQQQEEADAVFALKNKGPIRRTTVPEPFELGAKGRRTVREAMRVHDNGSAVRGQLHRECTDFYDGDELLPQAHASDPLTAPSVPSGLFSLHASTLMLQHTPGADDHSF